MLNNKQKSAQWKEMLQSALTDLKQLLHEDGVVSSYEIHSSGLVQSLLAMLSTTVWDQGMNSIKRNKLQKQRIRIFRNIFKVSYFVFIFFNSQWERKNSFAERWPFFLSLSHKCESLDKENNNSAAILIHKLISVLESIEKLPVYIYDPPGSGYGLQVLYLELVHRNSL